MKLAMTMDANPPPINRNETQMRRYDILDNIRDLLTSLIMPQPVSNPV